MDMFGVKLKRSFLVVCWSFRLFCLCLQKWHMHFGLFWIKDRKKPALCSCNLFPKLSIGVLSQYFISYFDLFECMKDCLFFFFSHFWRWGHLKFLLPFWDWIGRKRFPSRWGWIWNINYVDFLLLWRSFVYVHVLFGFFLVFQLESPERSISF